VERELILLSVGVFVVTIVAFVGVYWIAGDSEKRRLRARLKSLTPDRERVPAAPGILDDRRLSSSPFMEELLSRFAFARRVNLLLLQGGGKTRTDAFLFMSLALAVAGVAGLMFFGAPYYVFPVGVLLGTAPWILAVRRRNKRVKHFERLFPDALDILTGALRAGMALSSAIQVVAQECSDPVAGEFTILFEETRLGVDMKQALRNLAQRVDSKELHLFVIAVRLQRDTGGNLTEILEQTAEVIRERLRILGDVRAMTAQARLSGTILSVLPIALGLFILGTAPDYMKTMIEEPMGRYMLMTAAVLQVVGYFIMRRIAEIKV
jgi:tight adherence protein B